MKDVLEKLPNLLSERFLLGYVLPILILFAGNLVLVREFSWGGAIYAALFDKGDLEPVAAAAVLIGVVATAFVLAPLNDAARRGLERPLPCFEGQQRSHEFRRRQKLSRSIGREKLAIGEIARKYREFDQMLAANPQDQNSACADCSGAVLAVDRFEESAMIRNYATALKAAECAAKAIAAAHNGDGCMGNLRTRFDEARELLKRRAEAALRDAFVERQIRFADSHIEPTRLANLNAALIDYGYRLYGLNIDFYWRHLIDLKGPSTDFLKLHEDAERRREFLITMFYIAASFLIWAAIFLTSAVVEFASRGTMTDLATAHLQTGSLVLLGTSGAMLLYYASIVQSYRTIGALKKAVVDLHRDEVLLALKAPTPANVNAERETWSKLHRFLGFGEHYGLDYHRKPT